MLCPEGYSGIRDQREILCAAADCLALGVHAPWEGEAPAEPDVSVQFSVFSSQCSVLSVQFSVFSSQCSVIAESPLGRARLLPSRTTTQHAEISALFRVILRPSFPTEPNHHTTRSIFRVNPRHSAAIISRQGEPPHNTLNLPRYSASFRGHISRRGETPHKPITSAARQEPRPPNGGLRLPGRYDRQRRQHHATRSNFRVIPRHSAAIISHRAEPPHNTLKFPRHSASFRGHHFPPRRTTTQHAQFSASFRVIPRPSFPIALKSHTNQQHPRLGRSLALPGRPPPPRTLRPPTATTPHNTLNFPRYSALFCGHDLPPSRTTIQAK
ncbi:MAG: hypothetical protein RIT02_129 [Planctomycetota bacterium]